MANPPNSEKRRWEDLLKHSDLLFAFGLFGTVILLVLPIAPSLMDLLLSFSIGLSLLVLLIVIYVKEPPEFSVFPTILLSILGAINNCA